MLSIWDVPGNYHFDCGVAKIDFQLNFGYSPDIVHLFYCGQVSI